MWKGVVERTVELDEEEPLMVDAKVAMNDVSGWLRRLHTALMRQCAAIVVTGLIAAPAMGGEAVEFSKQRLEWQPEPAPEGPPLVLEMEAWLKARSDWQSLGSPPRNRYEARVADIVEANKSMKMEERAQVWAPSERPDLRARMEGRLENTASVMRAIDTTKLAGVVRYGPYMVVIAYSTLPNAKNMLQPLPMKEVEGTLYMTNELGTGDAMFSSIRTALVRHWGLSGEVNAMPTFCGC